MTATERAENIVNQWIGHKVSINGQRDDIAAAIEAAVAEERERCARIADAEAEWARQTVLQEPGQSVRIAARIREGAK